MSARPKALPHFATIGELCGVIGCSRWSLHRIRKEDPTFPLGVVLARAGPRSIVFVRAEFEAWLASRPRQDVATFATRQRRGRGWGGVAMWATPAPAPAQGVRLAP